MSTHLLRLSAALLLLAASANAFAQTDARAATGPAAPAAAVTSPSYRLAVEDQIALTVHGEGELSATQKIDAQGRVRLALIGDAAVAGRTVREAEKYIEDLYVQRKMLKKPMVSINVLSYVVREISILGAVRNSGRMTFPPEKTSLDIVEVITRSGGFLPTAKSESVKITRVSPEGRETTIELNVEAMLTRRGANASTPKEFLILPGDRIYVNERLF